LPKQNVVILSIMDLIQNNNIIITKDNNNVK